MALHHTNVFILQGLPPYVPELMFPPEVILNYNQTIAGVTNIVTSPTGLESTSVVLGKKHALKIMTSLFEILAAFFVIFTRTHFLQSQ